jgi:hypothetical protein
MTLSTLSTSSSPHWGYPNIHSEQCDLRDLQGYVGICSLVEHKSFSYARLILLATSKFPLERNSAVRYSALYERLTTEISILQYLFRRLTDNVQCDGQVDWTKSLLASVSILVYIPTTSGHTLVQHGSKLDILISTEGLESR